MIKSVLAGVAMTLFASVGLASVTNTFCVTETKVYAYTGSGKPTVDVENSTTDYAKFVSFTNDSNKITFTGVYDTTNPVTIKLIVPVGTTIEDMPSDKEYVFIVKTCEIDKTIQAWNSEAAKEAKNPNYDPNNKSNSTIRVVTHVLKGKIATRDPNVLFLGTRCGAHDLTKNTIVSSLNAIAKVGNVDWYLFESDTKGTASYKESGNLMKGEEVDPNEINDLTRQGNHSALTGFYNLLDDIITSDRLRKRNGEAYDYDYIVIETDGTRLAHKYAGANDDDQMQRVAEYLAPFYADERVIWVLDNGFDYYYNDLKEDSRNYFSYATEDKGYSQEIYQYGRTYDPAVTNVYRVNNGYIRNNNQMDQYFNRLDDEDWKAFLGIFDPSLYLDNVTNKTTQLFVDKKDTADVWVDSDNDEKGDKKAEIKNLYAGHEYSNQTWYDNAEQLSAYLERVITAVPFDAVIADSVVQSFDGKGFRFDNMGLSICKERPGYSPVRFYEVNTNKWNPGQGVVLSADSNVWVTVNDGWGYDRDTMVVTAKVNQIVSEWWNKIEVDIEDDGTFFQKCLATGRYTYDKEKGEYLLNPNKDEATIAIMVGTNVVTKQSGAVNPAQQWEFVPGDIRVAFGNVKKEYDQHPTNICLVSGPFDASNGVALVNYVISNSFDGVNWKSEEEFKKDWLVNATDPTNVIWMVAKLGYNTLIGTNTVEITPINVTVKSGDCNKEYDGIAGTNWSVKVLSEKKFLKGDEVSYTYSGTRTDAGGSDNDFSIAGFSNPLMAQNYNITLVTGKITIARAPITVVADDAAKKYGTADPATFSWTLDPTYTRIADGQSDAVYLQLSNNVVNVETGSKLVRFNEKGALPAEEDVRKTPYAAVISTNKAFAVQKAGVLRNYNLFFEAGDFTITPDKLVYDPPAPDVHTPQGPAAEEYGDAAPYCYVGIYDGDAHTIRFNVIPPADSNNVPAKVRFSADGKTWDDKGWENYSAKGLYKGILSFTDCTNKAPVYVQARNLPNYPEITNLVAYVTITQRTVVVTADSASKTYDGKPLTCGTFTWEEEDEEAQTGFVTGEGIESLSMTQESTITNVGVVSNKINEATVVFYDGKKAGTKKTNPDNYNIVYEQGELTVTPKGITVRPEATRKCQDDKDPEIGYIVYDSSTGEEIKGLKAESGAYSREGAGETDEAGRYKIVYPTNGIGQAVNPFVFGPNGGKNYNVTVLEKDAKGKDVYFTINTCKCSEPLSCVYAYRLKLSGKTIVGKSLANGKDVSCGETCWAKPGSYRVAGYIYGYKEGEMEECEACECTALADNYAIFWNQSKRQVFEDVTSVEFEVFDILRNSGAKDKAQVKFDIKGLKLAGFGAFNPKTQKLKNANGFFAGTLDAPTCAGAYDAETCSEGEPVPVTVFEPCTLEQAAAEKAIAFGRWSLSYKADKVSKMKTVEDLDILLPAGFKAVEE